MHLPTRPALAASIAMVSALLVVASAAPAGDDGPPPEGPLERVHWCVADEHTGAFIDGGIVELAGRPEGGVAGVIPADVTTMVDNGPPSNRIDLVFVGDGYLAPEIPSYVSHVNQGLSTLFDQEPFETYANYFNVHRVDVISPESGVDNDPVQGIERDTAMGMAFWCSNIERLLCINVPAAYDYANNAPGVDQIFAIANSTKYGGAGYTASDLATFSGGNGASPEVAIHEIGHSLGDLADEYDYGGAETYNGPEPFEPNVSILTESQMASAGIKWAAWLGEPGIDNFEGAYYSQFGIYRPDFNSKMRSLGQPFNDPSIEALVIHFYQLVAPLDDWTPDDQLLFTTDVVSVTPQTPVGHSLDVQWKLDGVLIDGATDATLDLTTLGELVGEHDLQVIVVDNTPFVRNEGARLLYMTEAVSWTISGLADCNDNGVSDAEDLLAGSSTDCNGNDRPDECDTWAGQVSDQSPLLSPIGSGSPRSWTMFAPPEAMGDVTLTFTARADLGAANERLPVTLNGTSLGSILGPDANDCPEFPDTTTVIMSAEDFNAAAAGGDVFISIGATPAVDAAECDPPSWVRVAVDYTSALAAADCNGNGLVDGCDILGGVSTDADGDGVPDECGCAADVAEPADGQVNVDDLVAVITDWGAAGGPADVNGDGMVNVDDLVAVISAWGACSP